MVKINKKQKVILATGGAVIGALWGITFILRATTWLDKPPIVCKEFATKATAYPTGKARVCLTEITRPWDEMSEDEDVQVSLYNPTSKERFDLSMRVVVPVTPRKLSSYWRVERAQVYNQHGVQITEHNERYTSNHTKYIPTDIKPALWEWLAVLSRVYQGPRIDYETVIDGVVERTSRVAATVTAAGLTLFRFIQASGEPE